MAASKQLEQLKEETTCSICQDFFSNPLMLDCGHNFCRVCITRHCYYSEENVLCPECRVLLQNMTFRENRKLASIVDVARSLTGNEGTTCDRHKQPVIEFCEDDHKLLCVACVESQEHTSHKIVLLVEAVGKYKAELWKSLHFLKKQLEENLEMKREAETKMGLLQTNLNSQRSTIATEFEQLHQFLHEEERILFNRLDSEEKRIREVIRENLAAISEKNSAVSKLIDEIREQLNSKDTALLTGIGATLKRCDTDWRVTTKEASELDFNFPLQYCIWRKMRKIIKPAPALVMLDPKTAHPQLVLSQDLMAVRRGDTWQNVPDNPLRFYYRLSVLSTDGFTTGKHYWEVKVGSAEDWAVGITRKSVRRIGWTSLTPEDGYWTVWRLTAGDYRAGATTLSLREEPRRIIVSLDYDAGRLSFYNADGMSHLYTFNHTFTEKMFPVVYTGKKDQLIKIVSWGL